MYPPPSSSSAADEFPLASAAAAEHRVHTHTHTSFSLFSLSIRVPPLLIPNSLRYRQIEPNLRRHALFNLLSLSSDAHMLALSVSVYIYLSILRVERGLLHSLARAYVAQDIPRRSN